MVVEKVSYNVNWKAFKKRAFTFFIPCLNPKEAKKDIHRTTKRLRLKTVTKVVIEDGVRGLRIWRV